LIQLCVGRQTNSTDPPPPTHTLTHTHTYTHTFILRAIAELKLKCIEHKKNWSSSKPHSDAVQK